MVIEYILFFLFLIPWLKCAYDYSTGRKQQVQERKRIRLKNRPPEMTALFGGLLLITGSIPYIGAFFYADLRYLWITIGVVYLLTGFLTLTMGLLGFLYSKYDGEKMAKSKKQAEKKHKKRKSKYWSKWEVMAMGIYSYSSLLLWLYSWRKLIT